MENLNNELLGEVLVEEETLLPEEIVENEEEVIEEAGSGIGKAIAIGATLGLAAVTGGIFLARKMKAKKRAKIEEEAMNQIIETLRAAGKSDEEIDEYLRVSKELHEEVLEEED